MSVVASSFDDLESLADIEREQKDLIEVFLEGASDRKLFAKYWFFNYLDRIDFKQPAAGGGCTAVIEAVTRSRELSEVPSYGIVDRDVWRRLRDHAALFEADDAAFHARIVAPGVYVTRLWEIEAYLMDAGELHIWLSTNGRAAPDPPCSHDELLARLDAMAECLLEVSELNVFLHHLEQPGLAGFAHAETEAAVVRGLVSAKVGQLSGPEPHGHGHLIDDLQRRIGILRAIVDGLGRGDRFRFLLRFVDSKAFVDRIGGAFGVRDRRIWSLAQGMLWSSARPAELEAVLLDICAGRFQAAWARGTSRSLRTDPISDDLAESGGGDVRIDHDATRSGRDGRAIVAADTCRPPPAGHRAVLSPASRRS